MTCVKTLLSIDTRDLNRTLKEVGAALGPDKMNIALKHTIQDTGRKVRTLVKSEIRKEYHAKAGRIGKSNRQTAILAGRDHFMHHTGSRRAWNDCDGFRRIYGAQARPRREDC